METPHRKFLIVLGILIWSKQAKAINCYSCYLQDKCNDPFKPPGVSTIACSGPCFKTKASRSNVQAVIRGCETAHLLVGNKCTDVSVNGITTNVCWCNENLCNYALPVGNSFIIMTALIVIYIALHE